MGKCIICKDDSDGELCDYCRNFLLHVTDDQLAEIYSLLKIVKEAEGDKPNAARNGQVLKVNDVP